MTYVPVDRWCSYSRSTHELQLLSCVHVSRCCSSSCSTYELQLLTSRDSFIFSLSTMERALLDLGAASGICVTDQFDSLPGTNLRVRFYT